jgi:hypothetical protein
MCVFTISLSAQQSGTFDTKIKYAESYSLLTGPSAAILTTGDSSYTYTFYKESLKPLKYDVYVSLDSTGGTYDTTTVITWKAKKFSENSWSTLKTVTWYNGSDTTFTMTESSTAQQYNYYQLSVAGNSDSPIVKLLLLYVKFWE